MGGVEGWGCMGCGMRIATGAVRPRNDRVFTGGAGECPAGDRKGRPYGGLQGVRWGGRPRGSPRVCVYIIYLYNKAVFFCDVKKIFCRRGKSAAKEGDFQIGSGGVRTGEVSPCARCRCKGTGGIRALFAMQKHSKIRNVPFPRPYGATGNDAQKTSCTGICAFSWCSVPA